MIASTVTTLAVFFPLLFWPGMVGQFMRYLPITVMICLLASLFMALVFIPVLGGIGTGRRTLEVVPGTGLTMASNASTGRFTGLYLRWLSAVLHRPIRVLLATVCLTIVSLVAYATFGNGVEFFPASEPDNVQVQVHARDGLSIHEKDRLIRLVERRLQGMPEISTVYARTLEPAGDSDLAEDVIGVVSFELVKWDQRRKANALIAEMRKKTSDMPGIRLEFREPDSGPDSGKPVNIRIASMSGEKLEQATDHVIGLMRSTGGFADVEDNRALPGVEWILEVDREEAARYGADLELLGNSVQMITSGLKLAEYRPDDASDELEIRIRYPLEQRNLSQLDNLLVSTATGLVPINNFVNLRPSPKTGTLQRIDGERVMTVQAGMQPGYLSNTQIELLKERLSRNPVDPDVTVNFGGEDAEMQETMQFLLLAFFVALFLMAVILVIQFNSFYQALLVLSAIVFSTCGVLFGLLVTGQALGIVMCGLGIIALAGIVVNNNIVLLDTYNSFRKSGHCAINAAMNTGALRLRPVLLTAVTTIAGLMPMVLSLNIDLVSRDFSHGAPSTQWWTQLSSTIAGGLAFSTLLTLFLTPSLLVLGDRLLWSRTGSRVASGNSATAPFNDRSWPTVAVS